MNTETFKNFVEICYSVISNIVTFSSNFFMYLQYPLFSTSENSLITKMLSALGFEGNTIADVISWISNTLLGGLLGDMTLLDLVLGSGIIIAIVIGLIKFFKL